MIYLFPFKIIWQWIAFKIIWQLKRSGCISFKLFDVTVVTAPFLIHSISIKVFPNDYLRINFCIFWKGLFITYNYSLKIIAMISLKIRKILFLLWFFPFLRTLIKLDRIGIEMIVNGGRIVYFTKNAIPIPIHHFFYGWIATTIPIPIRKLQFW